MQVSNGAKYILPMRVTRRIWKKSTSATMSNPANILAKAFFDHCLHYDHA